MKDNLSIQEQLIRKIELLRHKIGEMEKSESKHKEEGNSLNKAHEELEEQLVRRSVELSRINVDLQDEIKERKRAQEEIGALKKQIEFILGATKTGLDIIDSDYNMLYIDSVWGKVYGDHKGKKCYQYFMGSNKICSHCGVTKALETKKPVVTEEFLVKEGNRPIQVTTIPFQDKKGNWSVAEVNVDITEHKKAQKALQDSEIRYRTLFTGAAEGILVANTETRQFRYANPAICRMFGYAEEELMRLGVADLHPKESLDHVLDEFRAQARGEKSLVFGLPCLRKDGTLFYANINSAPMVLDGCKHVVGFFTDITEYKKTEEKIKIFSDAVASAFDCFFLSDLKGNITYANASACTAFGYTLDEFLKLNTVDLDVNPKFAKKVRQGLMDKGKWSGEVANIRKNKKTFSSLLSVFVIMDEKGSPKWTMGILRDISERKDMENKLLQDKRELEQKNLALKELVEHMERTKNKTKEDISINAGELIMPILKKLRLKGVSPKYVKLLEHNLKELTSSFGSKISQRSTKLTSREIEICNMVKSGLGSKEISELLNVSRQTIEKHRKNIRKKLGLSRKKANLTSHLQNL